MTAISRLEKIIGEESAKRLVNNKVYRFLVDAAAMNIFSLSYALNERFIAGMDWGETAKARLAAAIGNTITGRPYGIYRDFVMRKFGVREDSHWAKKYFADVFIFATGQTPLYIAYLAAAGADQEQMARGATFLTLVAPLTGRPQGATYDYLRNQFGLESPYAKGSNQTKVRK